MRMYSNFLQLHIIQYMHTWVMYAYVYSLRYTKLSSQHSLIGNIGIGYTFKYSLQSFRDNHLDIPLRSTAVRFLD